MTSGSSMRQTGRGLRGGSGEPQGGTRHLCSQRLADASATHWRNKLSMPFKPYQVETLPR